MRMLGQPLPCSPDSHRLKVHLQLRHPIKRSGWKNAGLVAALYLRRPCEAGTGRRGIAWVLLAQKANGGCMTYLLDRVPS